jgi:hypothetical protein
MISYATIEHLTEKQNRISCSQHVRGIKNVVDSPDDKFLKTFSKLGQQKESPCPLQLRRDRYDVSLSHHRL